MPEQTTDKSSLKIFKIKKGSSRFFCYLYLPLIKLAFEEVKSNFFMKNTCPREMKGKIAT